MNKMNKNKIKNKIKNGESCPSSQSAEYQKPSHTGTKPRQENLRLIVHEFLRMNTSARVGSWCQRDL